jgi:hypothetical protein
VCITIIFCGMKDSLMSLQLITTIKAQFTIFLKNTNPKTHFLKFNLI